MLEQRVYEFLLRKHRDLPYVIPDTFDFDRSDRPFAGRFIIPGVTPDDDQGLTFAEAAKSTKVAWVPPSESIATRKFSLKSMKSFRGHVVDLRTNRALMFESILEYFFANMLMATRKIVNIEDQPSALSFDMDGKQQEHTLDFLSTDEWGQKVGYAIKPCELLERDQTMSKVRAMKQRHVPTVVDDILVVTELQITRDKSLNALDINTARRSRCRTECDHVLDVIRGVGQPIKIWQLQHRLGDASMVWNAVMNLHYDREVSILRPGVRFSDESLVKPLWRH